ncbi:signal peptide peptidase SppA [Paracoccaceae bacterium GXU_MW_L88]
MVVLAILLAFFLWGLWGARQSFMPHIAEIPINGVIMHDQAMLDMLEDIAENDTVEAVLISINSPGGSTAGAEGLFAALRDVAEEKPVVATMAEAAASGGYVAAIGADHIVARGNTATASIGVILEYPDVTEVMDKIGIEMETVRSSPLKAEPSPFRETNPRARALEEAMIEESYQWFRELVGERRDLTEEQLDAVADGRVVTGRMALEAGLVDEIGGQKEAVAWIESQDDSLTDLPIYRYQPEDDSGALVSVISQNAAIKRVFELFSAKPSGILYSLAP